MSFADVLLRRLDDEMRSLAITAVAAPNGRDAFEYGRVSGIYAGLSKARDLLLDLLAEQDAKDI